MHSALYFGQVMHKRLLPFRHRFVYGVVSLYVDLDELPDLHRRLRLFSVDRPNVFAFHAADHGPRDGQPLRPWIDDQLTRAGIDIDGGPVRLLCFPRLWGYVFNPLTIWFCHHRDGTLRAILYEVNNTFGERHAYLIPVAQGRGGAIHQSCDKGFYVSPFIPMRAAYRFRLRAPEARLSVAIRQDVDDGRILVATQTGHRQPLDDRTLIRALARHPLMTLKVIAAIHWQALRLWRKGARFHARPAAPGQSISVIPPYREAAE